jgi:glutamine cyclotransferase
MYKTKWTFLTGFVILISILLFWMGYKHDEVTPNEIIHYEVDSMYPHDSDAFTQGLVFHDGVLYEGTGLYGESTIRTVDLLTGETIRLYRLNPEYFGEGITVLEGRVYQLTWKSFTGFIYNASNLEKIDSFTYSGEGWGLTHNGSHLIMSNGSSILRFLDPSTMSETRTLKVTYNGKPVTKLNELEHIDGLIYANVWQTESIAIIDPDSGQVEGWLEMGGLKNLLDYQEGIDVLNGIAYDGNNVYVTGKLWPNIFVISINK